MFSKLRNGVNLVANMGFRYIIFRAKHELLQKTGLLKKKFPINVAYRQYISLDQWRNNSGIFFFNDKQTLSFLKAPTPAIEERYRLIEHGFFLFFNSIEFNIGKDYDWVTNPDTGFRYDSKKHWTEISDY